MGYDGKKIVELNRLRAVGGREVGKFWRKHDVLLMLVAGVTLFLALFILFIIFSPKVSSPPDEKKQEGKKEEVEKKDIPRFIPPLLFGQPVPPTPRPLPWQERDGITPIDWYGDGGHHGDWHHGNRGHHFFSTPTIIVRPWGYSSYPNYVPYGGCYGCGYGRENDEERRPYFELHRRPNGETQMRWGFQ